MQIENSFSVAAPAERVYEYLLDVNHVVGCVPGAELSEVVDPDTFRGKVRIKVGPVTVSYNGTARFTARDATERTATLQAEGRETTGSGSARATTTMSVNEDGNGAVVRFVTDFTVVGRVAQFGRGIMEDVSRRLIGQMAECIRARLEQGQANATPGAGTTRGAEAAPFTAEPPSAANVPAPPAEEPPGPAPVMPPPPPPAAPAPDASPPAAAPVDVLALGGAIARDRLRGVSRRPGLVALVLGIAWLIGVRLRRRRRRRG